MSKTKSKIVDLEMGSDGAYELKKVKKCVSHKIAKSPVIEKKKHLLNEVDDFLNGIDVGLDFLDEIVPRVDRFLKLRG